MEQGRDQSMVLLVRSRLAALSEKVNNTLQPIFICHDLLQHAELLKDGRDFNYNSRDCAAKLYHRKRNKTSSHTICHPATSFHPFLPSLR